MNFIGPNEESTRSISFALLGDAGASDMGDMTAFRLAALSQGRQVDKIIHIGDLSYADGFQPLWDVWMRKVATAVAFTPYMTLPGNHEGFFNFASYRARFVMPTAQANSSGMYYSWNSGPVHFVALRSEGPDGLDPFCTNQRLFLFVGASH